MLDVPGFEEAQKKHACFMKPKLSPISLDSVELYNNTHNYLIE